MLALIEFDPDAGFPPYSRDEIRAFGAFIEAQPDLIQIERLEEHYSVRYRIYLDCEQDMALARVREWWNDARAAQCHTA